MFDEISGLYLPQRCLEKQNESRRPPAQKLTVACSTWAAGNDREPVYKRKHSPTFSNTTQPILYVIASRRMFML